ncbi:MAG: hypothetical protein OXD01_10955 [Gammaproteobacteria bacterium]|nr:hypothetical protein [Gammaproteobacteria bacterium]
MYVIYKTTNHGKEAEEPKITRSVNIMMYNEAWRAVNPANCTWSGNFIRRTAAMRIDSLHARLPSFAMKVLVSWIRKESQWEFGASIYLDGRVPSVKSIK